MVVGLGNPGPRYENTRHNVGFMVADEIARRRRIGRDRHGDDAVIATIRIAGSQALLVKPQTYMNLSGRAVAAIGRREGIVASEILLVYDDADLPLGRIRLRSGGGHGGHRGMASVAESLGTADIMRLRLGIGKDHGELADRVLSPFSRDEASAVSRMIERAADAVEVVAEEGILAAMNRFNRRDEDPD